MTLDYDRTALILAESIFLGDRRVAQKWGVTVRTVQNYRQRLRTDDELSLICSVKKKELLDSWITELPAAMRAGTDFIIRAAQESDPKDPNAIHAIAGAMKILAEIGLTKEIVDARLNRYFGEDRTESGQDIALISSTTNENE